MKLRNKKTGEIGYLLVGKGIDYCIVTNDDWEDCGKYNSLAELAEDWEDYEEQEPLRYWCISEFGHIKGPIISLEEDKMDALRKEIGNYFETKEEAEKAVEKLKAFKRLKDKGFGFESWFGGSKDISFWIDTEIDEDIAKDLDLLFGFGGEDE